MTFSLENKEGLDSFEAVKIKRIKEISKILSLDEEESLKKFQILNEKKKMPINKYIDHTVLKSTSTKEEIDRLCQEAMENQFAAVCVNLSRVKECKQNLKDSPVKIAVVVGFPLGATETIVKQFETKTAIDFGVNEIDMVMNVGKFLDGDYVNKSQFSP
jgi:deoxyribose-phosphate aldolase